MRGPGEKHRQVSCRRQVLISFAHSTTAHSGDAASSRLNSVRNPWRLEGKAPQIRKLEKELLVPYFWTQLAYTSFSMKQSLRPCHPLPCLSKALGED